MTDTAKQKKKLFDGRYEIQEIIGRGSRSVVYRATVVDEPNTQLAIKVLLNDKNIDDTIERLRKEALAMVSSRHEFTIRLDDFHTVDDICYLAMELAPDADLRKYIAKKGGKLPIKQIGRYFRQIAEGLSFMHDAGMVHRDIKPDNFLIIGDKDARLGDFGVTVLPGETPSFEELQKGVGTMDYMAPEVLEGKAYDSRSDVFSLGVSFYELFTGKHPFADAPLVKQLEVRQDDSVIPVQQLNPEIPDYLAEVIMRAMRYESKRRFATARELLQALKSGASKDRKDSAAADPSKATRKKRRRRRRRKKTSEQVIAKSPQEELIDVGTTEAPVEPAAPVPAEPVEAKITKNDPTAPASDEAAKDDFDEFLKELDEDFEKELDKELEELFKFDEEDSKDYDDLDAEIDRELEEILKELEAEEEAARKAEEEAKLVESSSMPSPDRFREEFENEANIQKTVAEEPEVEVQTEAAADELSQSDEDFLKSLESGGEPAYQEPPSGDVSDAEFLSELEDRPASAKNIDFSSYKKKSKNYSLLYGVIGLLFLAILYKFVFSGGGESTASQNQGKRVAQSGQTQGSAFPKFAGGEINFPIFPTGTYSGSIKGLIPGKASPLSIMSFNDGQSLMVLVGVAGWTPASIQIDKNNPEILKKPLRVASNGIVLQFSGISSQGTVSGKYNNIITGVQGTWSVSAQ